MTWYDALRWREPLSDWPRDQDTCGTCGRRMEGSRFAIGGLWCRDCLEGNAAEPQEVVPMKMGDAFPGKHLKAEDLGPGVKVAVTIAHVKREKVGSGDDAEMKPVVYFRGKERGLALNRTNFGALVDMLGKDDTDDWDGARIGLYTTKVDFQGKRVLAIRICEPPVATKAAAAPPPPPPPEPEPGMDADDDSIPF